MESAWKQKEGLTRLRPWPTIPRSGGLQWWAGGGREEQIQIRGGEDGNILSVFICQPALRFPPFFFLLRGN